MSQESDIKQYLLSGHRLTPIDALNMFGCFRLSARIYDLVHIEKLNIQTEIKEDNGKRYAVYYIPQEKQLALI